MADVRTKSKHTVKPAEPTPDGVLTLTELDQVAGANYVPTVYLYEPINNAALAATPINILHTLKESLSRALVPYYPVAGRLRKVGGGRLELLCNAMGVEIIEAESGSQLEDFGDFSATKKLQRLIPFVDHNKAVDELPLLVVQITQLRCGGVAVGIMISHALADGTGLLYFITDWARLARGEPLEALPSHDRTILRAGEPPRNLKCLELEKRMSQLSSLMNEHNVSEKPKEADMVVLPLSKAHIDKLKKAANVDILSGSWPYSRYEVLAAHIWRCTCKVRGHDNKEERALGIGVDARFRLSKFPPKYFGNTAFIVAARSIAGEILTLPLSSTCAKIRQTIEAVTEENIWSTIEFMKGVDDISICQNLRALQNTEEPYINPNPGVISWLSIPICGLDFGWGKEIHVSPGTHNYDGVSLILAGREEGSVIVYMSLQVAHLDQFKKHFYDDIV